MPTNGAVEDDVRAVLRALAIRKNVIISGPPGTGKSRLLNAVRDYFEWDHGETGADPYGDIPVPAAKSPIPEWLPSPDRDASRRSFQTVFDQNTKYRDFMRGLVPKLNQAGAFTVTSGTLYRASLHALSDGNASLVIVDEINRGPAVAAFGSALVGLEADKRLDRSGKRTPKTQEFEILGDSGEHKQFALPHDLYVLAAMNEADTSVEPLDVAFLRRFAHYRLSPEVDVLRSHLGLPIAAQKLTSAPTEVSELYEALAQAWVKINSQILLGRGPAYRLGHGALMHASAPQDDFAGAREYVSHSWSTLRAHVDEVFFGNTRALADVLRADDNASPYSLIETSFAGQSVRRLDGPERPSFDATHRLLVRIAST